MLICGPFHSTSSPMVGMGYLRSYLEQRGIQCGLRDLNIDSRAYLLEATGDRALVDELYSQSCRTYLAEAMVWSWHDPDGPAAVVRRAETHPSTALREFWEQAGIRRLESDPRLQRASRLLRAWLLARAQEIAAASPSWVGFSTAITNLASNLFLARELKRLAQDLLIVMGGPEVTDRNAYELLASFAYVDVAIPAPGYEPLAAMVSDAGTARTRPLPPGVWRRNASGQIEMDATRCWVDLNALPPADWRGIDLRRYVTGFLLVDTPEAIVRWYPTVPLHTSQGCSYNACDFCYNVALYPRFAAQSPERAVAEIRHQMQTTGSHGFFFTDFEFNASPGRVMEICRRIRELPEEIRFYSWLRLDKIDAGLLRTMYEAGTRQIFIGVEAVDDDLLRLMRKGYTARFAIDKLQELHEFSQEHPDLRFEFNLITNYPGETLASVRNTLEQIAENPHLFYHRVAAVVEFMLHEGTFAFQALEPVAVGCNQPVLPPGAHLRSYRHVYPPPDDPTRPERLEIWSAIQAYVQNHV